MKLHPSDGRPIDKLHYLESEIDVENLRIENRALWPILRISLGYYLANNNIETPLPTSKTSRMRVILKRLSLLWKIFLTRGDKKMPKRDILFFSNSYDNIALAGKIINKHLEPFKKALREADINLPIAETTFTPGLKNANPAGNSDALSLDFMMTSSKICAYVKMRLRKGRYSRLLQLPEKQVLLEEILNSWNVPLYLCSRDILLKDYLYIKVLSSSFRRILQEAAPKLVITTEFYSRESFALQLAAHEVGIRIADWQHGQQSHSHIAYGRWTMLNHEAMKFFPDYFFVWGEEERKLINSWSWPAERTPARIIGNGWLEMASSDAFVAQIVHDSAALLPENRKIALITLQNYCPPDWLITVIKKYEHDFFWIIKAHPIWPDILTIMKEKLKEAGIAPAAYSFEVGIKVPLPYLLRKSAIHITGWSTCALERLYFNLNTLIIHEKGMDYFYSEIESGQFKLTLTYQELETYLKKALLLTDEPDGKVESFMKFASHISDFFIHDYDRNY